MAEHEQPLSGDTIAHDLRSKALQASRLPDSHLDKIHGEIDDLLYDWEILAATGGIPEVPC